MGEAEVSHLFARFLAFTFADKVKGDFNSLWDTNWVDEEFMTTLGRICGTF